MIKLLGVPYDKNSSFMVGPSLAPPYLKKMEESGAANKFSEIGIEIVEGTNYQDLGSIPIDHLSPEDAYHEILNKLRKEIKNKDKIICIGGDHSISYLIIEAHSELYPGINVLQFDAHNDLYENFENNPYSHASPFARLKERNLINSLTQVGIRCLNAHQIEQIKRFDVRCIEMKDFNMNFINDLKGPLYISLDLDVLDPGFAPGISHYEPGGMDPRTLISIIQKIKVPIVGADIVEYNPKRDINEMTAMIVYKMFKEIASMMLK